MRSFLARFATGALLLSLFVLAPPAPKRACAAIPTAGVVVKFEQKEETFCVDATGTKSGIDIIKETKLPVVTKEFSGLGEQVCKIRETGTDDCSKGYWAYFRGEKGAWVSSQKGASQTTVTPGNVEGWVWVADVNEANPKSPSRAPAYNVICASSLTPRVGGRGGSKTQWLPWVIGGTIVVIIAAAVLILRARRSS
jgi:hypothetical protein